MSNVTFPLNPAAVHDGAITLDMFVKEPKRISRYISDNVQADLVSQKLFRSTVATGGAILFDRVDKRTDALTQPLGVIAPGGEFPVLSIGKSTPVVERVVKVGGRYEVTREAQLRNDPVVLQDKAKRVARQMIKDIDSRAFGALSSTLDTLDGALSVQSEGWKSALKVSSSAKTAVTGEGKIISDLLDATEAITSTDLGYQPDLLLLNSADALVLKKALGVQSWREVLADLGLTLHTSQSIKAGEGFVLQSQAAGVIGVEDPISTDSEYVKARQVTEFYTWATMAFGITDPFAVAKLSNLGA